MDTIRIARLPKLLIMEVVRPKDHKVKTKQVLLLQTVSLLQNVSCTQWSAPLSALWRINVGMPNLSTHQEHCCSKHVRLVPLQGTSMKKDTTRVRLRTELVIPSACLLPAYEERMAGRARYRLLATVFHHGPTSVAGHYVVRHFFSCQLCAPRMHRRHVHAAAKKHLLVRLMCPGTAHCVHDTKVVCELTN